MSSLKIAHIFDICIQFMVQVSAPLLGSVFFDKQSVRKVSNFERNFGNFNSKLWCNISKMVTGKKFDGIYIYCIYIFIVIKKEKYKNQKIQYLA